MECTCVRHTELPHTSKLFADFVYHFDRVQPFYPHNPADQESYLRAASQIDFPAERRAALVKALRIQNGDSESLRRLAEPGTLAVVTGQQVGLFSGPAYTIYKALTAAKLARELTERGIPAVPIFWLATEDHDFPEINHCWMFDSANQPIQVVHDVAHQAGEPVGGVRMAQAPSIPLDGLPFAEEIAGIVESAYGAGATFGSAFSALLKRLLPSYDLLHVDPLLPEIRELAAPTIRSALAHGPEVAARLMERNEELIAAGYHAQVHFEEHTSLVFLLESSRLLEGTRRITLKRDGRHYVAENRRLSTDDLIRMAPQLSPNALLRPVVQDSILPTVAYIGGPAELAYLAQSEVLYKQVLGRMPVALSRSGFTIFDGQSEKLMRRYGLSFPDFLHGEEVLRERIAAALVPPALADSMANAKSATDAAIVRLFADLKGFDPTLAAALEGSQRKIQYQLSKVERKIAREAAARDVRASRDAAYLAGLVFPQKHLQERFYSIVPFLARHGLDLIESLYENIQLDCPDHRLLVV